MREFRRVAPAAVKNTAPLLHGVCFRPGRRPGLFLDSNPSFLRKKSPGLESFASVCFAGTGKHLLKIKENKKQKEQVFAFFGENPLKRQWFDCPIACLATS